MSIKQLVRLSTKHSFTVFFILFLTSLLNIPLSLAGAKRTPVYVGALACKPCHEEEYKSFTTYARKSNSFRSIERMRNGLTEEEVRGCYYCHTTGYGKPGGFVSPEKTPQLKNAGCEVCHGPGEFHVKTGDSRYIKRRLTKEDCEVCHTEERVKAFRYKPLIHGGAH